MHPHYKTLIWPSAEDGDISFQKVNNDLYGPGITIKFDNWTEKGRIRFHLTKSEAILLGEKIKEMALSINQNDAV